MPKKFKRLSKKYLPTYHEHVRHYKRHPFVLPVTVFLTLFALSAVVFVLSGGQVLGPSDARLVRLSIDGQERTVPTRAKNVGELLNRLNISPSPTDSLTPPADTPLIVDNLQINLRHARPVTLVDQSTGSQLTTLSANVKPRDVATDAGLTIYPEDTLSALATNDARSGLISQKIIIDRATPATINLYGSPVTVRSHAATVGQLLTEQHITVDHDDAVLPSLDKTLTRDLTIFVARPGSTILSIEEPIAPSTETVEDDVLSAGTTQVRSLGVPGKQLAVYEVTKSPNGRETRQLLQKVVALQPVKQVVVRGTKVVITNPSDNATIGQEMAAGQGWTGNEWYCLYQLWDRESHWSTTAGNPSTGAYGIPQALPGSKMGSAGGDWLTNPRTQISWGIGYISGRYRSACGAWNFWQANHYY